MPVYGELGEVISFDAGRRPVALGLTDAIEWRQRKARIRLAMKPQPVAFHRGVLEPRIEMCGQTILFPVDLPVLFGDHAKQFPRLCRVEISTDGEPSASVYFAPVQLGAGAMPKDCPPTLFACAVLFRYLEARQESAFEDIPREVDCCFKDTCGFPIVHVSLVGQGSGGCDFRGVIHPQLNVAEEFAVRFSIDELGLSRA